MKIALMKDKQNLTSGIQKSKPLMKKEKKMNKGIEERMQKDLKDVTTDQNKLNKLHGILTKKAEIYEK